MGQTCGDEKLVKKSIGRMAQGALLALPCKRFFIALPASDLDTLGLDIGIRSGVPWKEWLQRKTDG
jgi:hypothetical protein